VFKKYQVEKTSGSQITNVNNCLLLDKHIHAENEFVNVYPNQTLVTFG